jgi:hypothetical protein
MKRMAWHWTLAASAMALAFAACTVTSDDGDDDAGTGGSGGTAGSGGSTATGGTGGAAGEAGSAGTAGSGGSSDRTCAEVYDGADTCSECLRTSCCSEVEACANEKDENGAAITQCLDTWGCFVETCTDPSTYEECKSTCDDGNFNVAYNEMLVCFEANCFNSCSE